MSVLGLKEIRKALLEILNLGATFRLQLRSLWCLKYLNMMKRPIETNAILYFDDFNLKTFILNWNASGLSKITTIINSCRKN